MELGSKIMQEAAEERLLQAAQERKQYIEEAGAKDFQLAAKNSVLAECYLGITSSDADEVRKSATKLMKEVLPTRAGKSHPAFDDTEMLAELYQKHADKASEHQCRAERLVFWAERIYDFNKTEAGYEFSRIRRKNDEDRSGDYIKPIHEWSDLDKILYWYQSPQWMIPLEDKVVADQERVAYLEAELEVVNESLNGGDSTLSKIDISDVLNRKNLGKLILKHTAGETQETSIETLVKIKADILNEEVQLLKSRNLLPAEILNAVKTGIASDTLKAAIRSSEFYEEPTKVEYTEGIEKTPAGNIYIDDLYISELRFDPSSVHFLAEHNVRAVSDLLAMTGDQLINLEGMKKPILTDILKTLGTYGKSLTSTEE